MTSALKRCSKCLGEFPRTTEYWHQNSRAKDGLYPSCKACECARRRLASQNERATEVGRAKTRAAVRKSHSRIVLDTATNEAISASALANRRHYRSGKYQAYLLTSPLAKLRKQISSLITCAIHRKGWSKGTKTQQLLGCSFQEFTAHIESQFKDGMSWENAGQWHYDHILPCSSAENEDELNALQHYSNFQPLWGAENLSKSDSLPADWKERKTRLLQLWYGTTPNAQSPKPIAPQAT